jgi:hypothetical protein
MVWAVKLPVEDQCFGMALARPNTVTLFDLNVGVFILKKLWVAAAIFALCGIYVTDVQAGPTWFMDGKCKANSRSKMGKMVDDLRSMPGKPIVCDSAIVSRLKNGGWFIQFTEKQGSSNPVGFVSAGDGRSTNPNGLFEIPLARVYPPQPLRAVGEDRIVFPAEGSCFMNMREVRDAANQVSCTSNTERDGYRLIMSVVFDVTKVSYQELPD